METADPLQAEEIGEAAAGLIERDHEEPQRPAQDADVVVPALLEVAPLVRIGEDEVGDQPVMLRRFSIRKRQPSSRPLSSMLILRISIGSWLTGKIGEGL